MNLYDFLSNDSIRNTWIYEHDIEVYIRRSLRTLSGSYTASCFDVANVSVTEERRGCGIFTGFLSEFETHAKTRNRVVYVESILEPRLYQFLLKRGYTTHSLSHSICPSVYKIIS